MTPALQPLSTLVKVFSNFQFTVCSEGVRLDGPRDLGVALAGLGDRRRYPPFFRIPDQSRDSLCLKLWFFWFSLLFLPSSFVPCSENLPLGRSILNLASIGTRIDGELVSVTEEAGAGSGNFEVN